MKINRFYTLYVAYSRNPSKVDVEELPTNYSDLHLHDIDYHIGEIADKKKRDNLSIHVIVNVKPKDIETGFAKYIANYEIRVSDISEEESKNTSSILNWAVMKVWDKIQFDYIKSMQDLRLPISGFPVTPIFPNLTEKEKEQKDASKTSQQ